MNLEPPRTLAPLPAASARRTLAAGLLMGLANLVPGVSGGTMILALGVYDRFIASLADAARLRFTRANTAFLALLGASAATAIVLFSGLAVSLVAEHRWIMYSLFIGLALGGVPELWRTIRPLDVRTICATAAGLLLMAWIAFGLVGDRAVAPTPLALALVGALAAASMILPGISGSYVLLVLGLYDTVIGSLSSRELRGDPAGSLAIIVPVGLGAAAGIGLLSSALRSLLARFPRATHAVLLGLLLGSVLGLWPFQQPVHRDLARREVRKATAAVLAGEEATAAAARYGADPAAVTATAARFAGASAGELKREADRLERFAPSAAQVGTALVLVVLGAVAARTLSRRRS